MADSKREYNPNLCNYQLYCPLFTDSDLCSIKYMHCQEYKKYKKSTIVSGERMPVGVQLQIELNGCVRSLEDMTNERKN